VQTLTDLAALRGAVARFRAAGERVAVVPTMGNLHRGHLALVARARAEAERVVVTVFVNPTQFGPGEDFAAYPRTPAADAGVLAAAGCDLLFLPPVAEVYPAGEAGATRVEVPGLSTILCGAFRPGHFAGVTSVVTRLFNMVGPDVAVFGDKDYQQLTIIRRMVRDLHLPVRIVGLPTVREPDGLALSSRNRYLSSVDRARALAISEGLHAACAAFEAGERDARVIEAVARAPIERSFDAIDYVSVADADSLAPLARIADRAVLAVAARLGATRLIDNVVVGEERL
jgi:pantoate--beta-alanine ligase